MLDEIKRLIMLFLDYNPYLKLGQILIFLNNFWL